jgi:hypothetical protein
LVPFGLGVTVRVAIAVLSFTGLIGGGHGPGVLPTRAGLLRLYTFTIRER